MFPVIETINDVLPHIADNPNFTVHVKDDYTVIDYILNTPDSFHNPVQKECRGLIFDADGKILSRRLHKFFNLNERPESLAENFDLSQEHWILEKLDGSMITPLRTQGKLTWGSKAGVTFLTPQIEAFVELHPHYLDFAEECEFFGGWTPIFEWCSNKNRIVISHPQDRLVLIAVRNNVTGEYASYAELQDFGQAFEIEVVKEYPGNVESIEALQETIKGLEGLEGFVLRFADGRMVKMKADQYCMFHRAKDSLLHEKNVIAILAEHKGDDFKSLVASEDLEKFKKFEEEFWDGLLLTGFRLQNMCMLFNAKSMSRKEFALEHSTGALTDSIIFKLFDEEFPSTEKIMELLLALIKKNIGNQAGVDKVRVLWGNYKWSYGNNF